MPCLGLGVDPSQEKESLWNFTLGMLWGWHCQHLGTPVGKGSREPTALVSRATASPELITLAYWRETVRIPPCPHLSPHLLLFSP